MPAERAPPRRTALRTLASAAAAAAATLCLPARAAWPSRRVVLVVGQPAGGVADGVARLLAGPLAKALGQPVTVESRPAAGGAQAAQQVAQAAPDALTLLLSHTSLLAVTPQALPRPPFDPIEDFTHVAALGRAAFVLASHPGTGMSTLADLQARARGEPLGYASAGTGSLGHLYGELASRSLGLQLAHVAPRGPSLVQELATGALPLAIGAVAPFVPHFHNGQVVPIAVTSPERSVLMPDIPTMADFGQSQLTMENVFGLSAPPRLPPGHVARLMAGCTHALARPELRQGLRELGLEAMDAGAFSYTQLVRQQVALLAPVVKAAGIRL